jgi:hypothetical protein
MEKLKKELKRVWPFAVIVALTLSWDLGALSVISYAVGVVALAVILSHLARKGLFGYLDVQILTKQVIEHRNMAAALLILAIVVLTLGIFNGLITLLSH